MKRQQIMLLVGDRMREISVANTYATDIGLNTYYWHDPPLEYDQPSCIYRDIAEDYQTINRARESILHVELEGVIFSDDPGTDGNRILGDFISTISVDPSWSGLCFNTQLVKSETMVETAGKTAVRTILYVDLFYRNLLWQP